MPRKTTLTPEAEDKILRHAELVAGDPQHVRVECLRSTLPVLKKAGFLNPRPFHRYIVPIAYREGIPQLHVPAPAMRRRA